MQAEAVASPVRAEYKVKHEGSKGSAPTCSGGSDLMYWRVSPLTGYAGLDDDPLLAADTTAALSEPTQTSPPPPAALQQVRS